MGSTTFGIDQITFLLCLCGTLIFVILGLCGYGIMIIDDRNDIFKDNRRLSKEVYKYLGQVQDMHEYINKLPGGAYAYRRSQLGGDKTIYADYKEITVPLGKPSQESFPDFDKAIKDATARLQAAAVH